MKIAVIFGFLSCLFAILCVVVDENPDPYLAALYVIAAVIGIERERRDK